MNYRKQFIITSFLFCILLVIPTKTYSQNNKQVNQLISTVYEKIVTTISTENNSEQKIKEILATHFDERKIGRFTLGAYGRKIPKETFQQYITLTKTLITKIFIHRFSDISESKTLDSKIHILKQQQKKKNIIVSTQITSQGLKEPIKVDWWVIQKKSGEYKIFDIRVLGIWFIQERRDMIVSILKNNRGDFDNLLKQLRQTIN